MSCGYDVSIIIVNYNGRRYLEVLFDSLLGLDCDGFSFEIVFVDNASGDDSVAFLRSSYADALGDRLLIAENPVNLGFAGGNNAGVSACRGRHIAFLNNDTKVDKNWLSSLYGYMQRHPECGMATSKLLFFYEFIKITFSAGASCGIALSKKIHINGHEHVIENKYCKNVRYKENVICNEQSVIYIPLVYGTGPYVIKFYNIADMSGIEFRFDAADMEANKVTLIQNAGLKINEKYDGIDIGFCEEDDGRYRAPCEADSGCGAAMMLKKEDFISCGGFDERFFMYYEDADLSCRIKKSGKKIMYVPDAVVRHIHTGSSMEWSPEFTYFVTGNRLIYIYKNISRPLAIYKTFRQTCSALHHRDKIKFLAYLRVIRFVLTGKVKNSFKM